MLFRRRPGIHRRPRLRGRPLRRVLIRQLNRAHASFERGEWGQAALKFEQLAAAAQAQGLPQASRLLLRAGQARLENSEHAQGIAHLSKAALLLAHNKQYGVLGLIRPKVVADLRERGFDHEATALDASIHNLLDQRGVAQEPFSKMPSPMRLPAKCRSCGGTLRPDEIEMFDQHQGACPYCGSLFQADRSSD